MRVLYEGLEKSEKKYRAIFEESRDTIFIATPEGHIVDVNPAGANLFGYSKEDIVFIPIQKFFSQSDMYDQFSHKLQQQGTIHDFEMQLCQRGAKQLDCLITATVRREENGNVLYQGIIRDITEYKQTVRERVRLSAIEHELVLAKDIQKSLLLPPEPDWALLDMICYNQPAYEMSGDFYAYYEFDETPSGEQCYAIAVGDISGKGMSAALLMGISLALFQSSVHHGHSPAELLKLLNETIIPYTQSNQSNCALCQVQITLQVEKKGCLRVANGGCIPPFIKHTNGLVDMVDVGGAPLGTTLGSLSGYSEVEVQIRPGDIIVLVSDGIIEAHNATAKMFGFEMMEKAIATGPTHSAHAMLEHIKKTLSCVCWQRRATR
ncbi:MAG: SpoIIE family protein phosphatase [Chloroflexaceae bacterium]|nr:SpoIIE family protein phosphatase [Chloroflexaceae bacterium]